MNYCEHGRLEQHWATPDEKPPPDFTWSIGMPEGMCRGFGYEFRMGDRVRVMDQLGGVLATGTVTALSGSGYHVQYDDLDSERHPWVPVIRLLPEIIEFSKPSAADLLLP